MSAIIMYASVFMLLCTWAGTIADEPADSDSNDGCSFSFEFEGENGPSNWGNFCPACNGDHQSPIDIDTSKVITQDLRDVDGSFYQNREQPYSFSVNNDGYTVTVELTNSSTLALEGGPLPGSFILKHLQFCWGSNDSVGSEHTFNGQRFPLEGQWGLYNAKYSSYEEASNFPDGIFRIAQLYPLKEEDNPSIGAIVSAFPSVTQPGQVAKPDEPLIYNSIFSGYPVNDFYSYNGSFTTPPCSQVVTWFVYPPLNGVSRSQLEQFRTLQGRNRPLVNNFRPLQPQNARRIVNSSKSSQKPHQGRSERRAANRRARGRHGASRRHQ